MSDWKKARAHEFRKRLRMFPTELFWNGNRLDATGGPREQTAENQRSNVLNKKPCTFTIWRNDYLKYQTPSSDPKITLTNRSVLQSYGQNFEIYRINDDPQEPTIDLVTLLKV